MKYTLGKIAEILDAELIGDENQEVDFLLYDSRRIVPSDKSLFFALQGKRDGHDFIPEMYSKGVKNFIVSQYNDKLPDANYILTTDTLDALHKLASYHRSLFDIPVVAITGSNGKTIVKEWLSHFISQFYNVVKSPKSFNSQIGVPLSVWEMKEEHEFAIFEAGISLPGEMEKLERIIKPRYGIFTNLGDAHQENFSSLKEKLDEKLKLFERCEIIYFNAVNSLVFNEIKSKFTGKKLIFWSVDKNVKCSLQITKVKSKGNFTEINGFYKNESVSITIPYKDRASIENAITVWLVLLDNLGKEKVSRLDFSTLPQVEMRLEQMRGISGNIIINDTYSSDLTSLRIALDYMQQQSAALKRTVILSDMEQTGTDDTELYVTVANMLKNSSIEKFIGVGQKMMKYSGYFGDFESYFFQSTDKLIHNLPSLKIRNELVLIKGARRFRFEKVSGVLQQKSHRTVFEINLNALQNNLNVFRGLIDPKTKIMVMVKAFSYGSGSYEIASLLQSEKVDYLGVAIADEGVELRESGISLPIIVMNPDSDNFSLFVDYDLEPEIYSFSMLDKFYYAVRNKIHYKIPVHIKFNTGMNRLGFEPEDADELIKRLEKYSDTLTVGSVFSHLVGSPEPEHDEFTRRQINIFEKLAKKFKNTFGDKVIAHILNSGGIERFPEAHMDMVRLGIGLYGISAGRADNLEQIGTLKTRISQLRKVKAGESIGYSRAEYVERDSIIAVLPIGYADGLNRRLSRGKGKVWLKGRLVPVVGNICMDMTMIDVTEVPGVAEGDEVIIFGKELPVTQVAQWLDTIPYEVLTSVSTRVKRVYLWE